MSLPAQEPFTGTGALSGSWTQVGFSAQTLARNTNQGKATAADGLHDILAFWNADAFANDQYAQAVYVSGGALGTNYAYLVVRGSGTGNAFVGYLFFTDSTSGLDHTGIIRYGANETPTTISTITTTVANGDLLRVEVSGTTLTAKKNGAIVGTVTDATIASGSAGAGVFNTAGAGNNVLIDDWEGGNLATDAQEWLTRSAAQQGPRVRNVMYR